MAPMTFPTIDPRGLFGTKFPSGLPGVGTHFHSAIEAYHKAHADHQRLAIIAPRRFGKSQLSDANLVHSIQTTGNFGKAWARAQPSDMFSPEWDGFMARLQRQLNKHPRKHTSSRTRTMSSRKRAGSRKGNNRASIPSDGLRFSMCTMYETCTPRKFTDIVPDQLFL